MLCWRQVVGWVITELSHGSRAQMVEVSLKAVTDFCSSSDCSVQENLLHEAGSSYWLFCSYRAPISVDQGISRSIHRFSYAAALFSDCSSMRWSDWTRREVCCWQFLFCCDPVSLVFLIVCDTWLGTLLHIHFSYCWTCLVLRMEYPGNWFCFIFSWHVAFLLECNISYV